MTDDNYISETKQGIKESLIDYGISNSEIEQIIDVCETDSDGNKYEKFLTVTVDSECNYQNDEVVRIFNEEMFDWILDVNDKPIDANITFQRRWS